MGFTIPLAASLALLTQEFPADVPPPCPHLFMVNFESGSASLSPEAKAILNNFGVPYARMRLTSPITVRAWSDRVESRRYSLWLSRRRGEAVRDYLLGFGIPKVRIAIKAYGEEEQIDP